MSSPSDVLQVEHSIPPNIASDGAYRYNVEIKVPSLRGLEPTLGFSYNSAYSGKGTINSTLGPGWSLNGFSTIQRRSIGGGAARFSSESFVFELDGTTLLACGEGSDNHYDTPYPEMFKSSHVSGSCKAGGNMVALTEDYNKIEKVSASHLGLSVSKFYVTSPDGVRRTYEASGVLAAANPTNYTTSQKNVLFRSIYLLSNVQDTQASPNVVNYTYSFRSANEGLHPRLATIEYGQGYSVKFNYFDDKGLQTTYALGGEVDWIGQAKHLVRSVEVKNGDLQIRAYEVGYNQSSDLKQHYVSSIREFGMDYSANYQGDISGPTLPPHRFYVSGDQAYFSPTIYTTSAHPRAAFHNRGMIADYDLDGRDDAVFPEYNYERRRSTDDGVVEYNLNLPSTFYKFSTNQGPVNASNWAIPNRMSRSYVDSKSNGSVYSGDNVGIIHSYTTELDGIAVPTGTYMVRHESEMANNGLYNPSTISLSRLYGEGNTGNEWSFEISRSSCKYSTNHRSAFSPLIGNFVPDSGKPTKELFFAEELHRITPEGHSRLTSELGDLDDYCEEASLNDEFPFQFVVDLNGDGVDEILVGDHFYRYENGRMKRRTLENSPIQELSLEKNVTFGDVNGDGSTDAIIHLRKDHSGELKVALSTGSGFAQAATWISSSLVNSNNSDHTSYARNMSADINGDGLADVILHNGFARRELGPEDEFKSLSARIYLSTGTGFVRHNRLSNGYQFIPSFQGVGDFDGDGDLDIIAGSHEYRNDPEDHRSQIFWQNAPRPFQINKVTTPFGGDIHVEYGIAGKDKDNQVPGNQQVVTSIRMSGLEGDDRETAYSYEGSRYNYLFRRTIGFGKIVETLPAIEGETGIATRIREFGQGMANAGRLLREQERLGNTVYRQTVNTYSNRHLSTGLPFRSQLTKTIASERFGGTFIGKHTEYLTNDFGQLTSKTEFGFDGGRDDRTTAYRYYENRPRYIVARPAWMVVSRGTSASFGDPSLREHSKFYYYDNASNFNVIPTTGNLTKTYVWKGPSNGARQLTSQMTYDNYGNVISQTDARGASTTIQFDAKGNFPISTTNALGHTTQVRWESRCGLPYQSTDANGLVTNIGYDRHCRETSRRLPSGQEYRTWYNGIGNPNAQHISQRTHSASVQSGQRYLIQRTYFDGFGQTYKTATGGATSDIADASVQLTHYDKRGNVDWSSIPMSWTDASNNNATIRQRLSRNTYDRLGRIIRTIGASDEMTETSYGSGNFTSLDGQPSRYPSTRIKNAHCFDEAADETVCGEVVNYFDSDGNTIRSVAHDFEFTDEFASQTSVGRTTQYDYDHLGQLVKVRDPIGATYIYSYDKLGNRIQSDDPGLGVWNMVYDLNGNLLRQTDAKNQIIAFSYDALNRPLSKSVSGPEVETVVTNYAYDEPVANRYNIGQLTTENVAGSHVVEKRYLRNGMPDLVSHTIDGRKYITQFAYRIDGSLFDQRLPQTPGTTHRDWVGRFEHDAANRITQYAGHIADTDYDLWGNMTETQFVGGPRIAQQVDGRRGWVWRMQAYDANGIRIAMNQYARSIAGRIESQHAVQAEARLAYEYDYAGRLLTATTFGNRTDMNQSFTYDASGTMRSNSKIGPYSIPARQHRPSRIVGGEWFAYDANGNMTRGLDGKQMEYDGENRPLSVTLDGVRTEYRYGAGGKRLMKIENVGTADETRTVYFGNVEIRNYGQGSNEVMVNYPHPNVRLVNGEASYLVTDHLGSIRAILNSNGALAKRTAYRPFGEAREFPFDVTETSETKGWIGERYDADAGLQYLNARYYDPALGMFIQPDWFEVTEPGVGTNRYSYSFNDPINLSDPSGNATDYGYGTPNSYDSGMYVNREYYSRQDNHDAAMSIVSPFVKDQPGWPEYTRIEKLQHFEASQTLSYNNGIAAPADEIFLLAPAGAIIRGTTAAVSVARNITAAGISARATTALVKKPHGNSRTSMQPQILYNLIDRDSGTIEKIGITEARIGSKRYSQAEYRADNVRFVPVKRYSNRLLAYAVERASILAYALKNGARPRLNQRDR